MAAIDYGGLMIINFCFVLVPDLGQKPGRKLLQSKSAEIKISIYYFSCTFSSGCLRGGGSD